MLCPALAALCLAAEIEIWSVGDWQFSSMDLTKFSEPLYQRLCRRMPPFDVTRSFWTSLLIPALAATGRLGKILPSSFVPSEDQGYFYANLQFAEAASLQRTSAACKKVEDIIRKTPGVEYVTTIAGFSLLSQGQHYL